MAALGIVLLTSACSDEPGAGGMASIEGKILVLSYDEDCTEILEEFYTPGIEVFLIAGDAPSYFTEVLSGPDGVFWFPFLRQGDYTLYALSEGCASVEGDISPAILPDGMYKAVEVSVNISDRREEKNIGDIIVMRQQ